MMTLYGIPNCDTVKKARNRLDEQEVKYRFHDYKKEGISKTLLQQWCSDTPWQNLLNKKSTTWRGLDAEAQQKAGNKAGAIALMLMHTSLIKRPVVTDENGTVWAVGFDAELWLEKQTG